MATATATATATAHGAGGWVRELEDYESAREGKDPNGNDDDNGHGLARPPSSSSTARGRRGKGSGGAGGGGGGGGPTSIAAELEQEMKLLNWHKLANEAALKAAIIKTNKLKSEDARFATALAGGDAEDKRQRIQQIIEEEQLRPLEVNTAFYEAFAAREARDERKVDSDVQRHIQHLQRLKETMAQREEQHRRRQRYKAGIQELRGSGHANAGGGAHSVPKRSNQEEDHSVMTTTNSSGATTAAATSAGRFPRRQQRSSSSSEPPPSSNADVLCSLDKLMELEKRIRHLEDAGLGVDGLEDDPAAEALQDPAVVGTRNLRFAKRRATSSNEPAKTVYAVKTKGPTARAKSHAGHLAQPTASSAARKRSLPSKLPASGGGDKTFLTSLPESKQRQLRRMTDRERRQFLKQEKAHEVRAQAQKQDVVIQDWMQRKRHAENQRRTSNQQAKQHAPATGAASHRRSLPAPPAIRAPLRGAASGKRLSNPHLQKFDDIRKGFERRKEALQRVPTTVAAPTPSLQKQPQLHHAQRRGSKGDGRSGGASVIAGDKRTTTTMATSQPHTQPPPGAASSTSTRNKAPVARGMQQQQQQQQQAGAASASTRLPPIASSSGGSSNRAAPTMSSSSAAHPRFGVGPSSMSGAAPGGSGPSVTSTPPTLLPRLAPSRVTCMPSPPPASAKNPSMPQFSRLHKR